jgi:hypothetical protein
VKAKGRTPGGDFERVFERVWLRSVVDSSSKLMKKKGERKSKSGRKKGTQNIGMSRADVSWPCSYPPPTILSLISLVLPHDGSTQPTAQESLEKYEGVLRTSVRKEAKVATIRHPVIDTIYLGGLPRSQRVSLLAQGEVRLTTSCSHDGIGYGRGGVVVG